MYLHLGSGISLFAHDVIGIFDYNIICTPPFQELLELARWNDGIIELEGKPKSVVLTSGQLYLVPVSRATLAKRWDNFTK